MSLGTQVDTQALRGEPSQEALSKERQAWSMSLVQELALDLSSRWAVAMGMPFLLPEPPSAQIQASRETPPEFPRLLSGRCPQTEPRMLLGSTWKIGHGC